MDIQKQVIKHFVIISTYEGSKLRLSPDEMLSGRVNGKEGSFPAKKFTIRDSILFNPRMERISKITMVQEAVTDEQEH